MHNEFKIVHILLSRFALVAGSSCSPCPTVDLLQVKEALLNSCRGGLAADKKL